MSAGACPAASAALESEEAARRGPPSTAPDPRSRRMPETTPATRASLLVRLRDRHDESAWREFVDVYAALIYGYARRRGLQDADAADLMQDVLRSVADAAGRLAYDPSRGTFRGWLYTVARNKLVNHLTARSRREQASGDSGVRERLEEQPAPDDEPAWEQEYRQRLFEWASARVRTEVQPATWEAFKATAVDGEPAPVVAGRLKMSVGEE
jgi:RNA polymerase sigma factor (sigma-70 family)